MEDRQPVGGLILEMYARDLPANGDPDQPCGQKWNRDTAWFSSDEARLLIEGRPSVGKTFELSELFVNRIVALHLVDTVNGQTEPFKTNETSGSKITAHVTAIRGGAVILKFEGKTQSKSSRRGRNKSPRGVSTSLIGSATYNSKTGTFTEFEMVAVGQRWGFTAFNDRQEQRERSPIGFVFQLAPNNAPANVPAFIWGYNARWLSGR